MCKLIFVFALILSARPFVSGDNLLDLSCQSSMDCLQFQDEVAGKNATCMQKTCVCFDKVKSNIECKPTNFLTFNKVGGPCPCNIPRAHCDVPADVCVCDNDFIPSLDKRRCIKAVLRLNMTCENDSQCVKYDRFAECDITTRICKCQNNYTQYDMTCHSLITLGDSCVTNEQCSDLVPNSLCFDHHCICAKDFVANTNATRCLPASDFGEMCNDTAQCRQKLGVGSVCDSGICTCDSKYRKVAEQNGEVNCMKVVSFGDQCYEHTDCYEFGAIDQKMECFMNQCICRKGYDENDRLECVSINKATALPMNRLVNICLLLIVSVMSFLYC